MNNFPFERGLECFAPDGHLCLIELYAGRYVTAYVYALKTWVSFDKNDSGWKLLCLDS